MLGVGASAGRFRAEAALLDAKCRCSSSAGCGTVDECPDTYRANASAQGQPSRVDGCYGGIGRGPVNSQGWPSAAGGDAKANGVADPDRDVAGVDRNEADRGNVRVLLRWRLTNGRVQATGYSKGAAGRNAQSSEDSQHG